MDFLPCPYLTQLALSHRVILLILSVQYNFLVNMIFLWLLYSCVPDLLIYIGYKTVYRTLYELYVIHN